MDLTLRTVTIAFILCAQCVTGFAFASSSENEDNSIEWQKIKLEEMIQSRARSVLTTIIGGSDFYVRTEISTKERVVPTTVGQTTASELSLGKLDMSVEVKNIRFLQQETVFNLIQSIKVIATIPKPAFDANKELIEKSLTASLQGFTRAPITVTAEPLLLSVKSPVAGADPDKPTNSKPDDNQKTSPKDKSGLDWRTELPKQMLPLAVLFASLLVTFILYRLLNVYRTIETRKSEAIEKQAAVAPLQSSRSEVEEARSSSIAKNKSAEDSPILSSMSGTPEQTKLDEQIRLAVHESPQRFMALVHRWLGSEENSATEVLCALPTILPMDSLSKLVEQLDEGSKRKWRATFEKDLEEGFEIRARLQIFQQLVTGIMGETSPVSEEIRLFLSGVRPDECAELAQKDQGLGAVLGKILSTPQTARMLALMPEDVASQVAVSSLAVTTETIQKTLPELRRVLDRIRSAPEEGPSQVEKAIELLREVGPQKESMLFAGFAKSFVADEMRRIAYSVCPVEIILKSGPAVHRQCLAELPLAQRAELILALPEKTKAILMSSYKPEEKIRELLEAEMAQVEIDSQRKNKVSREGEKLWRAYIAQFRRLVNSNSEVESYIKPLLDGWLQSQVPPSAPTLVKAPDAA